MVPGGGKVEDGQPTGAQHATCLCCRLPRSDVVPARNMLDMIPAPKKEKAGVIRPAMVKGVETVSDARKVNRGSRPAQQPEDAAHAGRIA